MGHVIVDTETRCAVRNPSTGKEIYSTEASAKAAMTRMLGKGTEERLRTGSSKIPASMVVMEYKAYHDQVPMREVTNILTGAKVMERADTPWHCSVASESYWSS